ncbi:MAG TPA: hypothetical protein ENN19_18905, partial [Chloroflexi bacterium]|nr:hypothetical protein [Chloroflexota bacterium]
MTMKPGHSFRQWAFPFSLLLVLLFVGSLNACHPLSDGLLPSEATYTLAPTLTPTPTQAVTLAPTATPLPTATWTPTPIPSPTPGPTLAPAAVETPIAKVQARLAEANVTPLCLRWEDTNGDGTPEWLGAYIQPGELPRLKVFILDGERYYDLEPLPAEPGD